MRNLLIALILFATSSVASIAQESNPYSEFNKFLAKNLRYAQEFRAEKVQGPVTLLLSLDENGDFNKEPILVGGSETLAQEVFRTLDLMEAKGTASLIPEEAFGKEYLLTVQFKMVKNQNTGFYIPERYDTESKILEKLNAQIQENPYFANFYEQRAEYFQNTGQSLLAELDLEKAKLLRNKELTNIVVVGYESSHKKSLIGE
ncbi:hypothetical protein [uncultured Algoriphagus sp.]|uniref:hypothetical protein n=1 Tax=uncultured Algoriphagus sp. TaxID=417365 RepID=UPI0025881D63|nr:hypothetical protein [uncultured Algoriphagus sp.]